MTRVDEPLPDDRLRRLQGLADRMVSRPPGTDLLDELLDGVRDLLAVDTAAILLLDPLAQQLVATAARGLEEEIRQGFRVAVGTGFAGRVAATRQPVVLDTVTPADVVSPLLLRAGVRSLLGVPVLAGDELLGVLHVGSFTRRSFTADDVALLQLAAVRAGFAAEARSHTMDHTAALALQRSLLPARLPELPGLDLAARYIPGHITGIGGDWYDVFRLPSGWHGMVIGDVSGHGLRSAVVMGRVRSALRAYALISDDPAEVLPLLDRKVHHFDAGSLTTALYAMISPDRGTVRLSVAGHLRPVLAPADGPPALLPVAVDPPLGLGRTAGRSTTEAAFSPGAVLVCYTDGLIERRGELIDVGIRRLIDTVRPMPAEALCGHVMTSVALNQRADDIALLVVRRHPA